MDDKHSLTKRLLFFGALLVVVGLLTGFYAAAALTGQAPGDGRMVVAAHVTTLMSGLVLAAYAVSLPYLRYSHVGCTRLALVFIVSGVAGWAFNFAKAVFATHALQPNGTPVNDVLFGVGTLTVVLPFFGGAVAWAWGLR